MTSFRKKWASRSLISLHSSNPHPFTLGGLEALIGERLLSIHPDTVLSYGSDLGYEPLRTALVEQLYLDLTVDNVMTTTGAQEGIFISMHALLETGDKVIAFTPVFEPLIATAQSMGCDVELLPLDSENDWQVDLQQLEACIDDRTKMVIINFPHNPTGALLSKEALGTIVELCERHDVWLFSDEVFRGLEHDQEDRLPAVAELYEKGVSLSVLSKAFGLSAIRVGWLASQNKGFLEQCKIIRGYLSICNDQLGERAASIIVSHSEVIFDYHRQHLISNLKLLETLKFSTEAIRFQTPKAGCTVFAEVSIDSEIFAEQLVEKAGLLVIPNRAFCSKINAVRLGFGNENYKDQLARFSEIIDVTVV